jgi:hypothetical protein
MSVRTNSRYGEKIYRGFSFLKIDSPNHDLPRKSINILSANFGIFRAKAALMIFEYGSRIQAMSSHSSETRYLFALFKGIT